MREEKDFPAPARRAALYIRVSTDEQARQGYSLPAQEEDLRDYARRSGYAVAGLYVDDGVSARKKYTHRKALMRLLSDVEEDKIDIILFIKLDRWFRNIADFYRIQEILDAHNVVWKTTQEKFDTETTNGRLYVNIRLSVAQDESDRTGDRIRFVNESKAARGECINGSLPAGLTVQQDGKVKRVVIDPDKAGLIRDIFDAYEENNSIYSTASLIRDRHQLPIGPQYVRRILQNPYYKGSFHGNPNYCPAIIAPERFDKIQSVIQSRRSYRTNPSHRIYIFSGLLRCQECGHILAGKYSKSQTGKEYHYYFCKSGYEKHACPHRSNVSENELEEWLLDNIAIELDCWQTTWEKQQPQRLKPAIDRAAILRKMDKLKELFVNDFISMEDYRADYEKYSAQLTAATDPEPTPPDFSEMRRKLSGDFNTQYRTWPSEQKRTFWGGLVKKIAINAENSALIYFA